MKILKANDENILIAAKLLAEGKLVSFPTETVYGLGADGLNPVAVAGIFEAKNRPTFNPLILHVCSIEMLERIALVENEIIYKLIDKFWPGPLTLVLPKKNIVPEIITAGHPTVAVRMPAHEVALKLIKELNNPVAAPSANAFSQLSPTSAKHVANQLSGKIDLILDGGNCNVGVESTIIKISSEGNYLLRPGGLALESIEKITGRLLKKEEDNNNPIAPGMLPFHYSPKTPLKLFNKGERCDTKNKNIGAIFFNEPDDGNYKEIRILSPTGNYQEAAANLFSYLHELEELNLDLIVAERIEEKDLGRAIMDRLQKAANRYNE